KCVTASLKRHKVQKTDVVVDACTSCQGIWFDANELNEVLPTAIKDLRVPNDANPTEITCPKCLIPLKSFKYPQTYVEIDMCAECKGLWLNRSELKEVKIIRRHFKKKGELEMHAPVDGLKGDLLDWVNSAIENLLNFDD
ncbi:MAG: zf-TFIIB domain-containing protein, partial [Pirellulales bacterium]